MLEGFDGDTPRAAAASDARDGASPGHAHERARLLVLERRHRALGGGHGHAERALGLERRIFAAPLVADPGTRYEYGINTDWLGRVVEAASGQSLDDYFAEHILGPLGMTSTTFLMSDEQRANSVPVHLRGEDGAWQPSDVDWSQEPEWWAGGHGLYSTPRDYLKFQRMLLGGGDARRRQAPRRGDRRGGLHQPDRRARLPARDRAPRTRARPPTSTPAPASSGASACCSTREQQPGMRAAGSGAWAGLMNTHFWVDRASGVTGAVYTQTLPFVEPRVFQVYVDFERALYASLDAGSVRSRRFERVPEEARQTERA